MHSMRLFAAILFISLATAHRPAVDGILQRPGKFTGDYTQAASYLCAIDR